MINKPILQYNGSTGNVTSSFITLASTSDYSQEAVNLEEHNGVKFIFTKLEDNIIKVSPPTENIKRKVNNEIQSELSETVISDEEQNRIIDKILETSLL